MVYLFITLSFLLISEIGREREEGKIDETGDRTIDISPSLILYER